MSEVLLTHREGAVLVLSNNNPAARNALSPAFYAALTQALSEAESDPVSYTHLTLPTNREV